MNAVSAITGTLASAMAAAFGEIEAATKSAANPHFKSKYADLTSVIEAIKPALVKHGLFFTQRPQPTPDGVTIETHLHHAGGENMSLGTLFVPANKNDAPAFGSALTYARRYALVTAFGVPTEDDDGNTAAKGQSQQGAVSPPAVIDDAQWSHLVQLIEASGANAQAFCTAYNIDNLKALPAAAYPDAIGKLNRKLSDRVAKAQEPVDA